MKKVIEHLKEYWKTYIAYVVCTLCLIENVRQDDYKTSVLCMVIFFLLATCFELDKAYKRLWDDLEEARRKYLKANKVLKGVNDKYEELGLAYIRLKKKYEPEELAKEIAKEYVPKKRRSRRWQNINTQTSK